VTTDGGRGRQQQRESGTADAARSGVTVVPLAGARLLASEREERRRVGCRCPGGIDCAAPARVEGRCSVGER
jgi:hypothetical protein